MSSDPDDERPDDSSRLTSRRGSSPRRIYLPWPVLTLIGAGVGFAVSGWVGLVFGGVLGYLAWRLR